MGYTDAMAPSCFLTYFPKNLSGFLPNFYVCLFILQSSTSNMLKFKILCKITLNIIQMMYTLLEARTRWCFGEVGDLLISLWISNCTLFTCFFLPNHDSQILGETWKSLISTLYRSCSFLMLAIYVSWQDFMHMYTVDCNSFRHGNREKKSMLSS